MHPKSCGVGGGRRGASGISYHLFKVLLDSNSLQELLITCNFSSTHLVWQRPIKTWKFVDFFPPYFQLCQQMLPKPPEPNELMESKLRSKTASCTVQQHARDISESRTPACIVVSLEKNVLNVSTFGVVSSDQGFVCHLLYSFQVFQSSKLFYKAVAMSSSLSRCVMVNFRG